MLCDADNRATDVQQAIETIRRDETKGIQIPFSISFLIHGISLDKPAKCRQIQRLVFATCNVSFLNRFLDAFPNDRRTTQEIVSSASGQVKVAGTMGFYASNFSKHSCVFDG